MPRRGRVVEDLQRYDGGADRLQALERRAGEADSKLEDVYLELEPDRDLL